MRSPSSESSWSLPEVRFAIAVGLLFASTPICQRLLPPAVGEELLGAVVAGAALSLPIRYAVGVGLAAWAFFTGFIVNVGGQLTFSGADVRRGAILVGLAIVGSSVAGLSRLRAARGGPVRAVAPVDGAQISSTAVRP